MWQWLKSMFGMMDRQQAAQERAAVAQERIADVWEQVANQLEQRLALAYSPGASPLALEGSVVVVPGAEDEPVDVVVGNGKAKKTSKAKGS